MHARAFSLSHQPEHPPSPLPRRCKSRKHTRRWWFAVLTVWWALLPVTVGSVHAMPERLNAPLVGGGNVGGFAISADSQQVVYRGGSRHQ